MTAASTNFPLDLARRLGCSTEAVALCRSAELIDLHIDTMIPARIWNYDPLKRHRNWLLGRHFFTHLDLPRMQDSGMSGAMWSITTNPFRSAKSRWRIFQSNLEALNRLCLRSRGQLERVRTHAEYEKARERGAQACLFSIQGGNALEAAPEGPLSIPDSSVTRITLVHLTNAVYGATSTPSLRRDKGLTPKGKSMIEACNAARIFVDLAHIHPTSFWDVIDIHDKSQPLIDTHTGCSGVRSHWRNLDDRQMKAIANTGGVVGIIFAANYVQRRGGPKTAEMIVEHIAHAISIIGEDSVAIGSDFDGFITPPAELRSGDAYPILVQRMLDRNWSETRIRKILGLNFLNAFRRIRPNASVLPTP